MSLSANQNELVKELEGLSDLNHRYVGLRCVSVLAGNRRGVMSLVFQAYDQITDAPVAIKVMDPDRLGDAYRLAAFEREAQLLELVEGQKRCLQLKQGLDNYEWEVMITGASAPLKFQCGYFVTEWIEEDIDG